MDTTLNLKVHTDQHVFEALEPEWNTLLRRSSADNIFSTLEWQSTWWDVFQPGELHIITCRNNDGKLIGIAPWFKDEEGVIRGIGCEDITDYLDVIADADHIDQVLDCFVDTLAERIGTYDFVQLCNIPEASPTYQRLKHSFERCNFEATIEQQEVCPIIRLPSTWDDYLSDLDKKQRHEVRRKVRRAAADTDWYIVDSTHELEHQIDVFLCLMAASTPDKQEFLQNERHVTFFRRIIPLMFARGWLQFVFLTAHDQPIASYLNFDYNRRIMVYNSGLDQENYAHLSPGIVLLAHNIRYAIEHDYEIFDFLRGDEGYKYRMGGRDTGVFRLTATPKAT